MRALAVAGVVVYHVREVFLPGGWTGVDLFFVISGYVIARSLSGYPGAPRALIADFYARRIRRLYPALVFMLLVVTVATVLFVPASWLSQTIGQTGRGAFFGLSNFVLAGTDDYFSPRGDFNPFTHTWSLGVEEQFYLVFPLLLLPWIRGDRVGARLARAGLPVLFVVSLGFAAWETQSAPTRAFYLLPSRFWEIAAGALVHLAHRRGFAIPTRPVWGELFALGGLAMVAAGFVLAADSALPVPAAIPAVVGGAAMLVGLAAPSGPGMRRGLLETGWARHVGRISYSLYLWHWPVLVLFRWTTGLDSVLETALALGLSFAAAEASYRWVEEPIRRPRFAPGLRSRRVIAGGLSAIGVCWGVAALLFVARPALTLSVTGDTRTWYVRAYSPAAVPASAPRFDFAGRRLLVAGDSHAFAYGTTFQMLREATGLEVVQLDTGGCAVLDLLSPIPDGCREPVARALQEIARRARPGDVVFLPARRTLRLGDQWAGTPESELGEDLARVARPDHRRGVDAEAADVVAGLSSRGVTILFDAPKPVFPAPAFRCSDWFNRSNPVCVPGLAIRRGDLDPLQDAARVSLERLRRSFATVEVWDVTPTLCPEDPCSAIQAGLPVFFDGDHLTAHGNRLLYVDLAHVLEAAWSSPP
jgi:peptidoglycan/LPS O-acetylase OafA/YrhL